MEEKMKKWECTVCGYIHEGDEPPEECPVCSADKSMFVEITSEDIPGTKPDPVAKPSFLATIYALASDLINTYHLHPIAVHTPNGIVPMAVVFLMITAFLGFPVFETAALYSLIFVLIAMPVVIFTGYAVWQKRYKGALTKPFKIKITASIISVFDLLVLVIWRSVQPEIITTSSSGRWVYLALSLVLLAAVGIAGHIGGKLVFGHRKN